MAYPSFPDIVYLDSSFLIDLLSYKVAPKAGRYKRCKLLYDHLLISKIRIVASLFTLEETIHYLFFRNKLLPEAHRLKFSSVKEFKSKAPTQFESFYKRYSFIPRLIVSDSRALGIRFEYPRMPDPRIDLTKRIRDYAIKLLRKYWQLDSKDAFHVAIARNLRIKMFISCDKDFAVVTEISSFNPLN